MAKFQKGDIVSIQGTVEDVQVDNNGSDYESVSIQWPDSRGYHDAKALTLVERPVPEPKIGSLWRSFTKDVYYVYLGPGGGFFNLKELQHDLVDESTIGPVEEIPEGFLRTYVKKVRWNA